MGRPDDRDDPRVRRPLRGDASNPFAEKERAVKRSLVISMLVLGLTAVARAQSVPSPEGVQIAQDVKKVDPVVVTATKVETPQGELGTSVSIITEDDVRTYNYSGLEEALRNVPGVEISRSGSLGKTASIRIRGAGPEQV